ncbi:site-specific integrase [Roseofilum sp. Belize Diploria]|uniref:tyrosine-type recombinase/integrase n=1 Tax=Roseofilum sp. Belize Diploria TaxID=2821501 RepID=UPI001B07EA13|nr:site-specific integrase [Roseofilum sp. Belize Diploria]MBP0011309.1 tyrosine-type recombinase/integrase [Roseofilum sp. Belize Diploria]
MSDKNRIPKIHPENQSSEVLPCHIDRVIPRLLDYYSVATLKRVVASLVAASNFAFFHGRIDESYWSRLKQQIPKEKKESKRTKQAYSGTEIEAILDAFECDKYKPLSSQYPHSHYHYFVEFLILTGCRPGEACALTWDDIQDGKIRFNKSYSLGILKSTKNGKRRYFPINERLRKCLDNQNI